MHGNLEPPSQPLLEPLLKLREHYARLVEDHERKARLARTQLAHLEVLLSNWSALHSKDSPVTVETLPQTGTRSNDISLLLSQSNGISQLLDSDSMKSEFEQEDNPELDNSLPVESYTLEDKAAKTSPSAKTAAESKDYPNLGSDVPMLPQYEHLTRIQAIEKVLEEHKGSVCHIDFIVRSLYGDLDPKLFKVVKGRVHSTLSHGREKDYWASVPDEQACYTLDLSLVPSKNKKSKSKSGKQTPKKPFVLPKTQRFPLLPQYKGKFLIEAVESFLEQYQGEIFSVDEIMDGIYGKLDDQQRREVKSAVLNELSRGHRIGRFSRVPDQVGFYTWDAKLL
ncbi:MAG: hypothetical protein QNJ47_24725 [Nostocaceae cyanobacterium]|nr:hypothetical protein [Nostocaceae cyanobacterium]